MERKGIKWLFVDIILTISGFVSGPQSKNQYKSQDTNVSPNHIMFIDNKILRMDALSIFK